MTDSTPLNLHKPDASTHHAGELLRQAREAQGLSLDHLAMQIKVTPAKLEALEAGRYDSLGDNNFTRALAMTVCRTLRISHTEILAALPAARLHALGKDKPAINEPFREHGNVPPLFDRGHRINWGALFTPQWLAPLGLLLIAALIYALPASTTWPEWLKFGKSSDEIAQTSIDGEDESTPSSIQVSTEVLGLPAADEFASAPFASASGSLGGLPSAVTDPSVASAASEALTPTQPGAAASVVAPAVVLAPTPAAAPLRIVLTDDSWVEAVDASGAKVISRVARGGETLELYGDAPFKLRIGNVSGVQVTFKGQSVPLAESARNNTARVELK